MFLPKPAASRSAGNVATVPREAAISPEDMVRIVLDQRHFGAAKPGASIPDSALTDVARGKASGLGYETNAAMQIVDAQGGQVGFELAQFGSRGPHAEAQTLARLRLRSLGGSIEGGKLVVAVDQYACPECLARLRQFARDMKLAGLRCGLPRGGASPPKPPHVQAQPGQPPWLRMKRILVIAASRSLYRENRSGLGPGARRKRQVALRRPAVLLRFFLRNGRVDRGHSPRRTSLLS